MTMGMGATRPGGLVGDVLNFTKTDHVERVVIRRKNWLERTVLGLKSLASVSFTRSTIWTFGRDYRGLLSRDGTIDYRETVGDERGNAIVMAALELLATTFAQSPIVIKQIDGDSETIVPNHELVRRLAKPNSFYSGKLLWKATLVDYMFGNAYWLKVRSSAGKPVEYYWIPSYLIEPRWPNDNTKTFISHYEYTPNGTAERIEVQDIVHFRNGMDPKNIRKGLSPLGALLREIATDVEAAEYSHTILRNLGVAGMVISPSTDKGKISQVDAERVKMSVMTRTTGDRRGEPLVLSGSVKVDQMGVDPGKLDLSAIRHIPEERITAIFGTPAVLVGLGTGLENATFSNVDGLRRIFYENKVIPLQDFIAADIHTQLLQDYEANPDAFVIGFDNENVRVLKEDENQRVDRLLHELENGGITLTEYRAERNREPLPGPDMLMLSSKIIPVDVTKVLESAKPAPAPVQPVDSNGNPVDANATGNGNDNSGNAGSGSSNTDNTGNKSLVRTKDIGVSIQRVRTRMHKQCARDVGAYLTAQRDAVLAQVTDNSKSKVRISWPRVQEDYEALKGVLEPWYKRVLVAVHDVVQDVLDTRYELSGTDERTYLKAAGLNIRSINEYTRAAVASAVATSVELDEDAEELAARIRELHVFSDERADLIAETELATASNLSQLESYKASGTVHGVLVTDGDSDEVCRAINGTKVRMSEVRSIPPLGHPHCVRRFDHILDASEFADSDTEAA